MSDGHDEFNEFRGEIESIVNELRSATRAFGPFASGHEGIAVIREEYKELEREVFHGPKDKTARRCRMREEATQLAAMALRFMVDVCREDSARPAPDVVLRQDIIDAIARARGWVERDGGRPSTPHLFGALSQFVKDAPKFQRSVDE